MEVQEAPPAVADPPARSYVEPWVVVASSASAVSARLFTHPRQYCLLSIGSRGRELMAKSPPTVDTIRIRIQTAGHPVPPIRELVPTPRLASLYAGELAVRVPFGR